MFHRSLASQPERPRKALLSCPDEKVIFKLFLPNCHDVQLTQPLGNGRRGQVLEVKTVNRAFGHIHSRDGRHV